MNDSDRLIAGILRVNHGGEHGAVAIYRGQILAARLTARELVAPLSTILAHEIRHRAVFQALMPDRRARPCRLMLLWSLGGGLLGLATGLLGRRAIMTCTAAVERTVHQHLADQKHWLAGRDEELALAIAEIEVEELEHLAFAEAGGPAEGPLARMIEAVTETLIWLATRGGSTRLARC
ncbi:MAG TPA: demethoxyubiquinone hydroxylase family protein [Caulobacter sp.]|nr:demethoxyubiquinone hydroxylase family protein [Caulobacter sp.]